MTTTEDLSVQVHYAPRERPACGAEGWTASYTDEPDQVKGCGDCLALVGAAVCTSCDTPAAWRRDNRTWCGPCLLSSLEHEGLIAQVAAPDLGGWNT